LSLIIIAKINRISTEAKNTINREVKSFLITFSKEIISHTASNEITVNAMIIATKV
jgi:hypothetical protein